MKKNQYKIEYKTSLDSDDKSEFRQSASNSIFAMFFAWVRMKLSFSKGEITSIKKL